MKRNIIKSVKKIGTVGVLGVLGSSMVFAGSLGVVSNNLTDQIINARSVEVSSSDLNSESYYENQIVTDVITNYDSPVYDFVDTTNFSTKDKKTFEDLQRELIKISEKIENVYDKNQAKFDNLYEDLLDNLEKFEDEDYKELEEKVENLEKDLGLDKLYNQEGQILKKIKNLLKDNNVDEDTIFAFDSNVSLDVSSVETTDVISLTKDFTKEDLEKLDFLQEEVEKVYKKNEEKFVKFEKEYEELFNKYEDLEFNESFNNDLDKLNLRYEELEKQVGLSSLYEKINKIYEKYSFAKTSDLIFEDEDDQVIFNVELDEKEQKRLEKINDEIEEIYKKYAKDFEKLDEEYNDLFENGKDVSDNDVLKKSREIDEKYEKLEKRVGLDKLYEEMEDLFN